MDPMRLLRKQHREVKALFKEVEKAKSAAQRRELTARIVEDLKLHMRIEESMFYPAVRELATKKAEDMVLEAFEEHGVVKLVIATLPQLDPDDDRFEARMTVLSELIQHHVEEEEEEMFKLAGRIDDEELDALGDRMQEEADAIKGSPARADRRVA